ncbi:hypothetical protein EW145_g3351 [Phellinidium pouzarii]|uniref:AAA+ ATPase domain-containing protein n=1 Tax=Phellinidium pouzarii TaxID=167371 RepID=A0A4S4L7M4_9AGAM|nr:hypothetical protein EW145_g3351 [Phellinidium pouzarii]
MSDHIISVPSLQNHENVLLANDGFDIDESTCLMLHPEAGPGGRLTNRTMVSAGAVQSSCLPIYTTTDIDAIASSASEAAADINVEGNESPGIMPGTLLQLKRVDEYFERARNTWIPRDSAVQKPASAVEEDKYGAYAFTVTRRFDITGLGSKNTIDIRSEWLRSVGSKVIGSVAGISWTAKPLKIDSNILLAFLPSFDDYAAALRLLQAPLPDDKITLVHLDFLMSTLRSEYAAPLAEYGSLLAHGEISFELLYLLFVPRSILYTVCPVTRAPRAVRLVCADLQVTNAGRSWKLDVEYVEHDPSIVDRASGSAFRTSTPDFGFAKLQNILIHEFKGATKITSLDAYPLKYVVEAERLKAHLIERGHKWVKLQGMHHKYYRGTAFHRRGRHVKVNITSRIMIDRVTFTQIEPNYTLPMVSTTLEGDDISKHIGQKNASPAEPAEYNHGNVPAGLDDELLLLASPIVYGFSLVEKLWLEFNVNHVTSIIWNEEPFMNLMLPQSEKKLVKSLVEAHNAEGSGFDDFVEGKGRGLVINLFGNPGVGKTLTAEAVSEHLRRPLYSVGAGDLGTKALALDSNLSRIFNISSNWDAVVLIDEADVFLEERSLRDIERNAMVAVFLRQLEYFRGILFLTTNRVRTFDQAFKSRIHVSLRYQDLTADSKRRIWVAFLEKARGFRETESSTHAASLTEAELRDLGERRVNGRQIKNTVRTASAIARSSGEEIGYSHLVHVLEIMEAFEADQGMA